MGCASSHPSPYALDEVSWTTVGEDRVVWKQPFGSRSKIVLKRTTTNTNASSATPAITTTGPTSSTLDEEPSLTSPSGSDTAGSSRGAGKERGRGSSQDTPTGTSGMSQAAQQQQQRPRNRRHTSPPASSASASGGERSGGVGQPHHASDEDDFHHQLQRLLEEKEHEMQQLRQQLDSARGPVASERKDSTLSTRAVVPITTLHDQLTEIWSLSQTHTISTQAQRAVVNSSPPRPSSAQPSPQGPQAPAPTTGPTERRSVSPTESIGSAPSTGRSRHPRTSATFSGSLPQPSETGLYESPPIVDPSHAPSAPTAHPHLIASPEHASLATPPLRRDLMNGGALDLYAMMAEAQVPPQESRMSSAAASASAALNPRSAFAQHNAQNTTPMMTRYNNPSGPTPSSSSSVTRSVFNTSRSVVQTCVGPSGVTSELRIFNHVDEGLISPQERHNLERCVLNYLKPLSSNLALAVTAIDPIEIPVLQELFELCRAELTEPNCEVKRLCYGPSPMVARFASHGFELPTKPGPYGFGVYFPDFVPVDPTVHTFEILICDVALGRAWNCDRRARTLDFTRVVSAGYDSVRATPPQPDSPAFVIYHPHQVVARYKLTLEVTSMNGNGNPSGSGVRPALSRNSSFASTVTMASSSAGASQAAAAGRPARPASAHSALRHPPPPSSSSSIGNAHHHSSNNSGLLIHQHQQQQGGGLTSPAGLVVYNGQYPRGPMVNTAASSSNGGASASVSAPVEASGIGMEELEQEMQCSICTELLLDATSLECSHTFCYDCLQTWLRQQQICPMCRHPIRPGSLVRNRMVNNIVEKMIEKMEDTAPLKVERQRRLLKICEDNHRLRKAAAPSVGAGGPIGTNDLRLSVGGETSTSSQRNNTNRTRAENHHHATMLSGGVFIPPPPNHPPPPQLIAQLQQQQQQQAYMMGTASPPNDRSASSNVIAQPHMSASVALWEGMGRYDGSASAAQTTTTTTTTTTSALYSDPATRRRASPFSILETLQSRAQHPAPPLPPESPPLHSVPFTPPPALPAYAHPASTHRPPAPPPPPPPPPPTIPYTSLLAGNGPAFVQQQEYLMQQLEHQRRQQQQQQQSQPQQRIHAMPLEPGLQPTPSFAPMPATPTATGTTSNLGAYANPNSNPPPSASSQQRRHRVSLNGGNNRVSSSSSSAYTGPRAEPDPDPDELHNTNAHQASQRQNHHYPSRS